MTTPKAFVCACEDVTEAEVRDAIDSGYRDLESLKRYTGLATGPCQGKACVHLSRGLLAEVTGADPGTLGAITYRPPVQPMPLGLLAGDEVEEDWAEDAGAAPAAESNERDASGAVTARGARGRTKSR